MSRFLYPEGNAPLHVFAFVTSMHCNVTIRHQDGESQDIELTPDEADQLANILRATAAEARQRKAGEL